MASPTHYAYKAGICSKNVFLLGKEGYKHKRVPPYTKTYFIHRNTGSRTTATVQNWGFWCQTQYLPSDWNILPPEIQKRDNFPEKNTKTV